MTYLGLIFNSLTRLIIISSNKDFDSYKFLCKSKFRIETVSSDYSWELSEDSLTPDYFLTFLESIYFRISVINYLHITSVFYFSLIIISLISSLIMSASPFTIIAIINIKIKINNSITFYVIIKYNSTSFKIIL
jgi:hypothetical protein